MNSNSFDLDIDHYSIVDLENFLFLENDYKVVDILEISEDADFFLENDLFHLNTEGHKYVANKLFNYVTINKIR